MSQLALARSDLYSQTQTGAILGVDRHTVRGIVLALRLEYKTDPTRSGKMLNRADIDQIAANLDLVIDWDKLTA